MAEFNIHVNDLKNDDAHPVAQAMILLKSHIRDETIQYDLDLALTEAVTNVKRHAYPKEETGPLNILVRTIKGKAVEITVTDHGRGIDREQTAGHMPGPEAEHGRGIPLMTRLCDRVAFQRRGQANSVTLTKNVPPAAWRTS